MEPNMVNCARKYYAALPTSVIEILSSKFYSVTAHKIHVIYTHDIY